MRKIIGIAALATGLALSACQGGGLADDAPGTGFFAGAQARALASAKTYFRQNNFGLAEKTFLDILKKDADHLEAWVGLAASYDRLGRYDLADRAYDRVVKVVGRRPEILNNMGYSYFLRGEKGRARATFEEAAKLAPGNPVVQANLVLVSG
jgi:Flp pilus assembly protein TadD